MAGLAKSCNAIGGKIRVTCPRCNKTKYAEVATGTRRKIVRCSCGMSASYSVNYRKAVREAASGRAQVVFNNSKESKIRLCDTSYAGVGFVVPPELALSLSCGQEISVKCKSGSGSMAQRKLRIRNITRNRVGGQYT